MIKWSTKKYVKVVQVLETANTCKSLHLNERMAGNFTIAGLSHKASCELIKQWVCQVEKSRNDFGKEVYDGNSNGYEGAKWAVLAKGVSGVEGGERWVICCYFCA
jgi:hypothetical protein